MRTPEPVRLLEESSDASPELRELLGSALDDGPSAAQLASLAARLAPLQPPPSPAAPAPAPVAPAPAPLAGGATVVAGLKLKVLVGVAALAGAAGSFQVGRVYERAQPPAVTQAPRETAPVERPRSEVPPEAVVPAPPVAQVPTPSPVPAAPSVERAPTPVPPRTSPPRALQKPVVEPPPEAGASSAEDEELLLIDDAHRALQRGAAEEALSLLGGHASRFQAGTLAQEREVLAIEALMLLGRRAEAQRRAGDFQTKYPTSSHLVRLQKLLLPPAPE
ncbi:hypothetical protein SAMN05443572_113298 [Myxococcus fulvus]|uniref:Uncharacterized protein n=1 Tax=Myxococcus fulvus TaxID=33 RepID=A0A511TCU8_MYXFU|nr:hypothetical protein [Myxococcus fulvus]GEN12006.1 hypothetical protein MFU01_70430 [Myxococcus fulvus]SEU39085.1 hypothetical protein SAMN05443572_113298 [Myxococcus fulvus]